VRVTVRVCGRCGREIRERATTDDCSVDGRVSGTAVIVAGRTAGVVHR